VFVINMLGEGVKATSYVIVMKFAYKTMHIYTVFLSFW